MEDESDSLSHEARALISRARVGRPPTRADRAVVWRALNTSLLAAPQRDSTKNLRRMPRLHASMPRNRQWRMALVAFAAVTVLAIAGVAARLYRERQPPVPSDPSATAPAQVVVTTSSARLPFVNQQPTTPEAVPSSARELSIAHAAEQRQTSVPIAGPLISIREETRLLEEAEAALKRGRPQDALRLVEAHRRAYARGELSQEREALEIVGLCSAGERERGMAALHAFQNAYPGAAVMPRLNATCRLPPEQEP